MTPQPREARNSRSTKRGSIRAAAASAGLGEEDLEVLAHDALQHALLGMAAHAGVLAATR